MITFLRNILIVLACSWLCLPPLQAARGPFTTSAYFKLGLNAIGQRINGASTITVGTWIYFQGTQAASEVIVSEVTSSASIGAFNLRLVQTGSVMEPQISARSRSADANQTVTGTGAVILTNTWMHLAATVDYALSYMAIYTNGVLIASNSVTFGSSTYQNSSNTTQEASIGVFPVNVSPFLGIIAEVGIWNTKLTVPQIQALAVGRNPLKLATPPVVYFPLYDGRVFGPVSGITATTVGTPGAFSNPRIYK